MATTCFPLVEALNGVDMVVKKQASALCVIVSRAPYVAVSDDRVVLFCLDYLLAISREPTDDRSFFCVHRLYFKYLLADCAVSLERALSLSFVCTVAQLC